MKTLKTSFFILSISLLLFSCKTMQIEKPKESYLPSNISPSVSELPLQIELDVKKLEMAINKKMVGVLFEGSNITGKDLSVKITKAQNFIFSINNNVIEYKVPLKIWSKFAWKVEKFGMSVGDFYEATGSISLTYKTNISIDKNWKLVSKTTSSGYEWIETPKVNVVGIAVPVTPIANLALSKCDQQITTQIDKALAENIELKKYITQIWAESQKPKQVNAENDVWIRTSPKDIYVSPFTTKGNKLNLAIALYAQVESFIGTKPSANASTPVPVFKYISRPAQQFNLNIGADVTFDKIVEMAKKQLVNKKFSQGKKSITITDLSLFGSEGKAIFVADVIGSLKGRIYFEGNMTYNPEKMAVEITNPEFNIKTSNALVKSASWLLHGLILKQLTPYLTYPIKSDLENLKNDANKMISNYSVMDGVALKGKLSNINVLSLNLVPGALRISTNIKGDITLKIDEPNF